MRWLYRIVLFSVPVACLILFYLIFGTDLDLHWKIALSPFCLYGVFWTAVLAVRLGRLR